MRVLQIKKKTSHCIAKRQSENRTNTILIEKNIISLKLSHSVHLDQMT